MGFLKDAVDAADKKTVTHELYAQIYNELKLNPRTVQWYATEGYIPKPEREGVEAYYRASAEIPTRLRVILTLQKRYDLKLKEIKKIIEKQNKGSWDDVYNFIVALDQTFPTSTENSYGDECVSEKGLWIGKAACEALKARPVLEIKLDDLEDLYDESLKKTEAISASGESSLDDIFRSEDEIPF